MFRVKKLPYVLTVIMARRRWRRRGGTSVAGERDGEWQRLRGAAAAPRHRRGRRRRRRRRRGRGEKSFGPAVARGDGAQR